MNISSLSIYGERQGSPMVGALCSCIQRHVWLHSWLATLADASAQGYVQAKTHNSVGDNSWLCLRRSRIVWCNNFVKHAFISCLRKWRCILISKFSHGGVHNTHDFQHCVCSRPHELFCVFPFCLFVFCDVRCICKVASACIGLLVHHASLFPTRL